MNKLCLLGLMLFATIAATAQDRPIGYWRAHMPYTNAENVATDGVTFYVVTKESFYTYNAAQNEITAYSKVEGMADVEMSAIGYDDATGIALLAYKNANIDLFIDNTFYNIPDIKLKTITGNKNVNDVYAENGLAYLSMSFGVVVVDLEKKEIKETYSFTSNGQSISVQSFASDDTYCYVTTETGMYRASKNNPNLQAFSQWTKIDNHTDLSHLLFYNHKIYVHNTDSVFTWNGTSLNFIYASPYTITQINAVKQNLYVSEYLSDAFVGKIKKLDENGQVADSFNTGGKPVGIYALSSGDDLYEADQFQGLTKYNNGTSQGIIKPEGPNGYGTFDILPYNKTIYIMHGSYDRQWRYNYNTDGFSIFKDDHWKSVTSRNNATLSNKTDLIRVAQDPTDQSLYIGSYKDGIFHYNADGSMEDLTHTSPVFEGTTGDPNAYRISGLAFDNENNLWITQYGAPHELVVKTPEGNYYNFNGAGSNISAASVIIDDYDQKWYLTPTAGVAVYNDNHTIDNKNDDAYARMDMTKNMPSNLTYCIAKDKDGTIWVGTDNGIGIINCPGEATSGTCAVEKRIVQYDNAAGYLFEGESVLSIAVDGADRKWVGTANGVWLISPSADKIIYRFTTDNSPLPSNIIQKISIDPVTGDVYIGTDLGLISYRSTAVEGAESNSNVITFPNPVPSGYNGTIAIKGLTTDGDVRITDITGQLVYRTKALGGQAVWSGKDYTGRRPQSGVYLIFVTNTDGTQTYAGKLAFLQ